MFRQALKVLLPVVVTLSLTLGALAWSASNVAFAASQPGQGQTAPTATPTAAAAMSSGMTYFNPLLPYNTPLYGTYKSLSNKGGPGFRCRGSERTNEAGEGVSIRTAHSC
jgi:hypothetical protein